MLLWCIHVTVRIFCSYGARREPCLIRRGRRWRSAATDIPSRRRWSSPLSSACFPWDWTSALRETRSWSDSPRAASRRYGISTRSCFSQVTESSLVMQLHLFCRKTPRTRCGRPFGTTSTCRERWALHLHHTLQSCLCFTAETHGSSRDQKQRQGQRCDNHFVSRYD